MWYNFVQYTNVYTSIYYRLVSHTTVYPIELDIYSSCKLKTNEIQ
jgi:hypothetical protein